MRPAHFLHSNVSCANRQELFARRINFENTRLAKVKILVQRIGCAINRQKRSGARIITFANSAGEGEKGVTELRTTLFAIIAALALTACGWFWPALNLKSESGRTTYRAAEDNPAGTVPPTEQNIPGEKKK